MKRFDFPFPSPHPPEAVWEALTTPLSQELNHAVNSPRVNLEYEGLSEEDEIAEGTRLIYTPNSSAIDLITKGLLLFAPREGTGVVDTISPSSGTRIDLIERDQDAAGHMEYRVEEGKGETSVLIVRGEFIIIEGAAKVIANRWPAHLGDANKWLIEHGIRNPAERFVEHVPKILAGQGS